MRRLLCKRLSQWLLAWPEMSEFLQSRSMAPYKEPWMTQVDTMKKLQGWTDCSVSNSSPRWDDVKTQALGTTERNPA